MSASGSSGPTGLSYIKEARKIGGFSRVFVASLGGLVVATFSMIIRLGDTATSFLTGLVEAQGQSAQALIFGFFRAPGRALQDVWNTAAQSLGLSPWNTLGPFVIVALAASVLTVVGMVTWYLDRRDSDFVGTGLDVPVVGNDEDGDPSDET